LTHQSIVTASDYVVTQPGPAFEGQPFVSYVNNRLILVGVDGDSEQKIIYSGPQAQFDEVRSALRMGKQISEATLHIERDEEEWKMTLKAEQFHFSSFKSPKVQIERDDLTDEASEKDAVFYERMHLLETGLQLFDSLYEEFLKVRLSSEWNEKKKAAKKWYERGH